MMREFEETEKEIARLRGEIARRIDFCDKVIALIEDLSKNYKDCLSDVKGTEETSFFKFAEMSFGRDICVVETTYRVWSTQGEGSGCVFSVERGPDGILLVREFSRLQNWQDSVEGIIANKEMLVASIRSKRKEEEERNEERRRQERILSSLQEKAKSLDIPC